jgi:urocanate hydratase
MAAVSEGIPSDLPESAEFDDLVSHAPIRKDILNSAEKRLAVTNALRYFPIELHQILAEEFAAELLKYGRIYMHRYRPRYPMYARPVSWYPAKCPQAAAIMLMIQNNLDPQVAQHPHELITYGGNGAVFQNWAQYRITMKYLSEMSEDQTLVIYSGHPMGLFPSHPDAPRLVITNGMMIPNHSKPDDLERYTALGVTQYGQMTAGSYMYIGPQGIVHGTTITLMNAARMVRKKSGKALPPELPGKGLLFVTAGLGGMSGAQPKAASIAGCISVTAEINEAAARKRFNQGWVDELIFDQEALIERVILAQNNMETISLAFVGNVVDVWELFLARNINVDLGSDQTSLHNPFAGGYYPAGLRFDESNEMMFREPEKFRAEVESSLRRHALAINEHARRGMYFFDYGNAFLLAAARAGADVGNPNKDVGREFRYPSYVQDILGPLCFDYGFGPFRWVCCSGDPEDLEKTDAIAETILSGLAQSAPPEIVSQLNDNISWIKNAGLNKLVVGSQARILYADAEGRIAIAKAFNKAIGKGDIGPVVLGRDHHDVSGTDSPYRETSNVYDGSRFTADMAVQNFAGDAIRGATWVSLHNGGGVGWGEVINGGFGLYLDGTEESDRRLQSMLHWDVNNGIARRAWARNEEALFAIKRAMKAESRLVVTIPTKIQPEILNDLF